MPNRLISSMILLVAPSILYYISCTIPQHTVLYIQQQAISYIPYSYKIPYIPQLQQHSILYHTVHSIASHSILYYLSCTIPYIPQHILPSIASYSILYRSKLHHSISYISLPHNITYSTLTNLGIYHTFTIAYLTLQAYHVVCHGLANHTLKHNTPQQCSTLANHTLAKLQTFPAYFTGLL